MTTKLSALSQIVPINCPERTELLNKFYIEANNNPLVLNKWFAIQAMYGNLSDIQELVNHPSFTYTNPNTVRSLLNTFTSNMYNFHNINGLGYEFIINNIIKLDKINPQVAARLAVVFSMNKKLDIKRKELIENQLKKLILIEGLSSDTFEIVNRCLK